MHTLILLLISLHAHAELNEKELKERHLIIGKVFMAAGEASRLPPCEALDHLSKAALETKPGKNCPKALKIETMITTFDHKLRMNCRALTKLLEAEFGDAALCKTKGRLEKTKEKLLKLQDAQNALITAKDTALFEDPDFNMDSTGKGEFARFECGVPPLVAMMFRKKQMSQANEHYGLAFATLNDACDPRYKARAEYLDYLKKGRAP